MPLDQENLMKKAWRVRRTRDGKLEPTRPLHRGFFQRVLTGGGSRQRPRRVLMGILGSVALALGLLKPTARPSAALGQQPGAGSDLKHSSALVGHEAPVWSAVFSPDGQRLLTASWDKTARLWDSASGTLLATLKGHEASVGSAAFCPDGHRLLTASKDHTARLWIAPPEG